MHSSLSLYNVIFLSGLLLTQVTAVPLHEPRQEDVGIESVNLSFNSDCPTARQDLITSAWDDAIKLVSNIGTVDFNDVAAIEFFGPPALNSEFPISIRRLMALRFLY